MNLRPICLAGSSSMSSRSWKSRVAGSVLAFTFGVASFGCRSESPPPNFILVSIDSLRPDHLGSYGYSRPTSPNIDRIAGEGVLFERAYSVTSWTLPSHLTMLTGLDPLEHGVVDNGQALAEGIQLLPQGLALGGYRSAAVVSGPYLNRRFGYDRGWVRYDDSLVHADQIQIASPENASLVTSPTIHERAKRLIDELAPGPFFLFLHYFDVHYDYIPPAPWDKAFDPDYSGAIDGRVFERGLLDSRSIPARDLEHLVALYDGEIASVDHWIGQLDLVLSQRGLAESTVLIITADHGEEFFEHSRLGHRNNLFDSTLRVPLVIRLPGRRFAGTRSSIPVSLSDLVPTIAALAGLDPPVGARGRELIRERFGKFRPPAQTDLFASLLEREAAVLRDDWKLIARLSLDGRPMPSQVYLADLASDPNEARNLALEERLHAARLVVALRKVLQQFAEARQLHPPAPLDDSPELEKQLRALGYI